MMPPFSKMFHLPLYLQCWPALGLHDIGRLAKKYYSDSLVATMELHLSAGYHE